MYHYYKGVVELNDKLQNSKMPTAMDRTGGESIVVTLTRSFNNSELTWEIGKFLWIFSTVYHNNRENAGKACLLHSDNTEIKPGKRKIRANNRQSCFVHVTGNIKKFTFGQISVGIALLACRLHAIQTIYFTRVNILHHSNIQFLYRSH